MTYQIRDPNAPPEPGEPDANPLRGLLARPDDLGLAETFEALHEADLAWSEERAIWRSLSDGVWIEDKDRSIHDAVREFARRLEIAVAALPEANRADWNKAARILRSRPGRESLIRDAKTGLCVPESAYDVDPLSLNTPAGVLDLKSIQLRTIGPQEQFTKRTAVAYRPGARDETWDAFLAQVLPDESMRAYAQRCFGAGLSGLPGQRLVFVLHGPSGGGKSTITGILSAALASYAATLRHDALAMRTFSNTGHTSELVPLVGARAAFVHEVPDGMQLNAALLKTIVGGEEFSLSEKGKPHFATRFAAKLYLVSNHPLTLSATDDAAWARIQLIPFEHPIPNPDREAIVALSSNQSVLEACLAWAVEGWQEFRANGLQTPAAAMAKMAEQRQRNSLIGEWLAARVRRAPDAELPSTAGLRDCVDFLARAGSFSGVDPRRFATEMEAAGFTRRRTREGIVWVGGTLVEAPEGTVDPGL